MPTLKQQIAEQQRQEYSAVDENSPLKQQIAAGRWREKIEANVAEKNKEFYSKAADPTTGMSTYERSMAGIGAGMMNVVQGAGNMAGLVDDETIAARKEIDAPLMDTTAGMMGQFGGEMVALAPLGAIGTGAKAVHAGVKAGGMLPTAARVLSGRTAAVAGESALAGGVLANPNERGTAMATSALAGTLLSKTMAGLSRVGKDGLAKVSDDAKNLMDRVERLTGKRPFVPVNQAIDKRAGSITSKTGALMDAISMLPSATAKMANQVDELADDVYSTNIKRAFSGGRGDKVERVLRKTGDMQKALEAGKNYGRKSEREFNPVQQILDEAARKSTKGRYSPKQLLRSSEKSMGTGDISNAPFRDVALEMEGVLGKVTGKSTVAAREAYHLLGRTLGGLADAFPGIGPMLGSKGLQNFLLGNNPAQRALRDYMETTAGKSTREVMSGVRRTLAAQGYIPDEVKEATEQVRGMM